MKNIKTDVIREDNDDISYHKELYVLLLILNPKDYMYEEKFITDLDDSLLSVLKYIPNDKIASFMIVPNTTVQLDWKSYVNNLGIDKDPKDIQNIVEKKTGIRPGIYENALKYTLSLFVYKHKIDKGTLKKIKHDNEFFC